MLHTQEIMIHRTIFLLGSTIYSRSCGNNCNYCARDITFLLPVDELYIELSKGLKFMNKSHIICTLNEMEEEGTIISSAEFFLLCNQ